MRGGWRSLVIWMVAATCTGACAEDEWGDVQGRFVYDGPVPPARQIPINKDPAVFGDTIRDESLLVKAENQGVANVVVFLLPSRGEDVPVHRVYANSAQMPVDLEIRRGLYSPRVVLLRTTQTLVERNFDSVDHATLVHPLRNPTPSFLRRRGNPVEFQMHREEDQPILIGCSVHPWMRAYVLVRSNPYMAASNADGRFEIQRLPVGSRTFRVWHERVGWLRNLTVGPHRVDDRGRLTLWVKPEGIDLGDIRVPNERFDGAAQPRPPANEPSVNADAGKDAGLQPGQR